MSNESKIVLANKQNGTTTEIIDNSINSASKKFYLPNTGGNLLTLNEADSRYLSVKDRAINITAGVGGDFAKLTDALEYCKQNINKKINAIPVIRLLSDFSDDLLLQGFPAVYIDCNGYKLAGKLFIGCCPCIRINKLKIDKGLTAFVSHVWLTGGATAGSSDETLTGFGSSLFANSSFISVSGDVKLNPMNNNYGIFSKGMSHIYLVYPSTFTQTTGLGFAAVISGGIISTDGGVRLDGVTVSKASQSANVLTTAGIIMGTNWN